MLKIRPGDLDKLFNNQPVPGSYQEQEILAAWIGNILKTKGEKYVKRNRRRILRDWSAILKYGLSKI